VFETLVVQPIFNVLVAIYALLPGHNFGFALIVFTIVVRLALWPLVKKQLHQAKAVRELQPELKRIKAATKGDKQKESLMIMELYKEREISPFGSIGILIVQLVILIGLYNGLSRVVSDPNALLEHSYGFLQNLSWMKELAGDISKFDLSLFGVVDLSKAARLNGVTYWPALLIVAGSAIMQYFQSKQLLPDDKDAKGLRRIMKEAGEGKQADTAELNAAVGRSTKFFLPFMIFFFTVGLPAALGLYWLVSGLVAYWQQAIILKQDETELEESIPDKIIEGEVIDKKTKNTKSKNTSSKKATAKAKRKKRR
jgi:YidC/Oxa1 family membrane protein insertase